MMNPSFIYAIGYAYICIIYTPMLLHIQIYSYCNIVTYVKEYMTTKFVMSYIT